MALCSVDVLDFALQPIFLGGAFGNGLMISGKNATVEVAGFTAVSPIPITFMLLMLANSDKMLVCDEFTKVSALLGGGWWLLLVKL